MKVGVNKRVFHVSQRRKEIKVANNFCVFLSDNWGNVQSQWLYGEENHQVEVLEVVVSKFNHQKRGE